MAKPSRPLIAPLCETREWIVQRETVLTDQIAVLQGRIKECEEELVSVRIAKDALEA